MRNLPIGDRDEARNSAGKPGRRRDVLRQRNVGGARAVPAPDIEFIYDTTVRKQYSFANTADAISYAHGICDKITGGASYAKVIGDVKNDMQPHGEYSANYLISNALNV